MWEAHKTVIRGELIAYGSYIKKERRKEIEGLLEKISVLERKHKENLDPGDNLRLENLQIELSQCLDHRVKNKIRYFANRFYEQGNKCGRLLAKQLKKEQESRHVHNLSVQGRKIVKSQAIAAEFKNFYKALYNIQTTDTLQSKDIEKQHKEEMREYIKDTSMLTLSNTIIEEIERPITVEELSGVITPYLQKPYWPI